MNVKMKHLMTALIASAAVSQALHAQEAPSAVAQDTKQVEQAADGMANKVAGWLDKLSDSVRTLGEKAKSGLRTLLLIKTSSKNNGLLSKSSSTRSSAKAWRKASSPKKPFQNGWMRLSLRNASTKPKSGYQLQERRDRQCRRPSSSLPSRNALSQSDGRMEPGLPP